VGKARRRPRPRGLAGCGGRCGDGATLPPLG